MYTQHTKVSLIHYIDLKHGKNEREQHTRDREHLMTQTVAATAARQR